MTKEITPEMLASVLAYNSDTGAIVWRHRPVEMFAQGARQMAAAGCWNTKFAGKPALCGSSGTGYLQGQVFGITVKAHRAAWCLHYGRWPENEIDHIDGIRSRNTIANLRDVDRTTNMRNKRLSKANKTGATGVYHVPEHWYASITVDGKLRRIGSFPTFEEAVAARRSAETEGGYHPLHGRK